MKKFFTLIAMALMAIGANAQTEWNFSNWTAETISETKTVDGLTVYAASDASVVIDGSKKTVDGVKYTQRLKLGGTGAVKDGTPVSRVLAFDVTGSCNIAIIACSSSSSGTDRNLIVETSDGTRISDDSQYVDASTPTTYTYSYTGTDAATFYVYSSKSGINLYDIKVTYSSDPTAIKSAISIEEEESPLLAPREPYNISGQRVSKNAKGLVIKNGKKYFNK